ncbi:MAG: DUF5683 domain-containing protein [Bacteroidota bacterium]
MIQKSIICLIGLFISFSLVAQEDSLAIDSPSEITDIGITPKQLSKKMMKLDRRKARAGDRQISPKKAVLLSLGLPGAGQIYNKRYWKLPLVYGALGGMTYLVITNTQELKRYRTAYLFRTDDDPNTVDEFEGQFSDSDIQALRNSAHSNVELSYIGLFIAYTLTGVDAFVDAHLHSFDIGDDLSLDFGPEFMLTKQQTPAIGVGLKLRPSQNVKLNPSSLF